MDSMSNHRMSRLLHAREQPPAVLAVFFFGYLGTMVLLGVYRPSRTVIGLMSIFTSFVGVVIYLILSMSALFQGTSAVNAAPFELVLEVIQQKL